MICARILITGLFVVCVSWTSKWFSTIDHDILSQEIKYYVYGQERVWLKYCLCDCKQCVRVYDVMSCPSGPYSFSAIRE